MESFLMCSVTRSVKFDTLCRQLFRTDLDFNRKASIVAEMQRLFDENTQASVFYFEQCSLYQRNLRRKNNPMSNLKTNKNGKK